MDFSLKHIKLIVGLGNTGKDYQLTRHNAGFICVDTLAETLEAGSWKLEAKLFAEIAKVAAPADMPMMKLTQKWEGLLAKPTTLMNNSGKAIDAIMRYYKINPDEILVVHDDMDIAIGKYKLAYGKGPKVHNGIISIEKLLHTSHFWRLRMGIENREIKGNQGVPGMRYALERFTPEEQQTFQLACTDANSRLIESLSQAVTGDSHK